MCLEPEFFDARDALIRHRESEGDIELEHFLKPRHVSLDRLYRFGLLKNDRDYFTTADLFVHEITNEGACFMEADEDYQLIFVRRDDVPAFGRFLNRARRVKAG